MPVPVAWGRPPMWWTARRWPGWPVRCAGCRWRCAAHARCGGWHAAHGGFGRGSGRRCCSLRCCFSRRCCPCCWQWCRGPGCPRAGAISAFGRRWAKSAAARVDAWFALPPQHKDIAVKWLLLEQGALCLAGCLFALRRPPAPRNEKAVEA